MTTAARPASQWDGVLGIMASRDFRSLVASYDRRSLIAQADALDGPVMHLLHWEKLRQMERIPRHDEGQTIPAIQGIEHFGAHVVEIFMVSHRWLRPSIDPAQSHPDSPDDSKARAIDEFSEWRRQWVEDRYGFLPEIYYWIDYSCIDQDNTASAAPLLPLWVACCERFLRIETPDYDERAWCLLEALLSYAFSFADHHAMIGLDYQCGWPNTGSPVDRAILDPRLGGLTNSADMALIAPLVDLALAARPARKGLDAAHLGETTVRCYHL